MINIKNLVAASKNTKNNQKLAIGNKDAKN